MKSNVSASLLPSFFIVGAQKAGTTTLHNWLMHEENITLPMLKETHFFSFPNRYKQGIEWYHQQFKVGVKETIIGEIDPDYMFYPDTANRIKKYIQAPRFIFILRQPLERAYSHFLMSIRRGFEPIVSFPEALATEASRNNYADVQYMSHLSYLARGHYCEQIERFQQFFPNSPMHFINFDLLFSMKTAQSQYHSLCNFIGIPVTQYPNFNDRYNPAGQSRSVTLRNFIYGKSFAKRILGKVIQSPNVRLGLATWLDRLNSKPLDVKQDKFFIDAIPDNIRYTVEQEIDRVQILTGLNLQDWKQGGRL